MSLTSAEGRVSQAKNSYTSAHNVLMSKSQKTTLQQSTCKTRWIKTKQESLKVLTADFQLNNANKKY